MQNTEGLINCLRRARSQLSRFPRLASCFACSMEIISLLFDQGSRQLIKPPGNQTLAKAGQVVQNAHIVLIPTPTQDGQMDNIASTLVMILKLWR